MDLMQSLQWRYATKRMNGQIVPQGKLDIILEAIRLSASSMGLQPYRVVVVDNPQLKELIHAKACPQPQVMEGSHLLVFASWINISDVQVDEYMQRTAAERNIPVASLQGFSDMIKGGIASRTKEQNADWASRQAYIGLGFGLTAAALEGVDACPMEGFSPSEMDLVLDLPRKGLRSVALMALGFRDAANDYLAGAVKVRVPKNVFFIANRG